jgi:aldose 1-epimerase
VIDRLVLRNEPLEAMLVPRIGGSIAWFDWHNVSERVPILRGNDAPGGPLEAACFPLVPYCNRIRGGRFSFRGREVTIARNMAADPSPLHGQGWLAPWQVLAQSERHAELRYEHAAGEWPWSYEATQAVNLHDDRLELTLTCTNRDQADMPCGLGYHPYFPCGPATTLTTQVEHVWTIDAEVLPVRRVPAVGGYDLGGWPICGRGLDNGYDGWSGTARIGNPALPFAVEMSSPQASFFQLYSPESGALFVAEPVSHANAALNAPEAEWPALGLQVLAPGEAMQLTMTIAIVPSSRGARA